MDANKFLELRNDAEVTSPCTQVTDFKLGDQLIVHRVWRWAPIMAPVVVFGFFYLCIIVVFGSLHVGLRYLRGEQVIIDPQVCTQLTKNSDGDLEAVFTIHNFTQEPIKILGAHTGCGCLVVTGLPTIAESGARFEAHVVLRDPEKANISFRATIVCRLPNSDFNVLLKYAPET